MITKLSREFKSRVNQDFAATIQFDRKHQFQNKFLLSNWCSKITMWHYSAWQTVQIRYAWQLFAVHNCWCSSSVVHVHQLHDVPDSQKAMVPFLPQVESCDHNCSCFQKIDQEAQLVHWSFCFFDSANEDPQN